LDNESGKGRRREKKGKGKPKDSNSNREWRRDSPSNVRTSEKKREGIPKIERYKSNESKIVANEFNT
jgi:hypothetical protein